MAWFGLIDDITFDWVEDLFKLVNLFWWSIEELESGFEILPSCIEFEMPDRKLTMGSFHVCSFVFIWSSCDQSNKLLLSDSQFIEINLLIIVRDSLVFYHELVKLVDDNADGLLAA